METTNTSLQCETVSNKDKALFLRIWGMGYQYSISSKYNVLVTVLTNRCDAGGHVELGELRGPQLAVQLRVPPLDLGQLLLQRRDHALGARHLAAQGAILTYYIGNQIKHHLDLRLFSSVSILLSFSSMTFLMASLNMT